MYIIKYTLGCFNNSHYITFFFIILYCMYIMLRLSFSGGINSAYKYYVNYDFYWY